MYLCFREQNDKGYDREKSQGELHAERRRLVQAVRKPLAKLTRELRLGNLVRAGTERCVKASG